jgi:hypothetical protein
MAGNPRGCSVTLPQKANLWVQEGEQHYSAIEGFNGAHSTLCRAVTDFMERCEEQ